MLQILVGAHDYNNTVDMGIRKTYEVERIVVHTDRQGRPSLVDKCLIRVKGSIDLQVHTPLCLPEHDFDVRRQRNGIVLAGE